MKPVHRKNQSGAVLVIALLFLTILTILGVTAMTATTFEEKMAGHTRDTGLAFQAADAALRDARRDINSITVGVWAARTPTISGQTGFGDASGTEGSCADPAAYPQYAGLCMPYTYDATKGIQPPMPTVSLTGTQSVEFGTFTGAVLPHGTTGGIYLRKPRYIIEAMCFRQFGTSLEDPSYCNFYRITAAGFGANPNTQVTVQEIYLKP